MLHKKVTPITSELVVLTMKATQNSLSTQSGQCSDCYGEGIIKSRHTFEDDLCVDVIKEM